MLKAYKYRLYPNKTQELFLNQVFGDVRFVWNKLVENFNSFAIIGPNKPLNEKILKDDPNFSWLKNSISYALQQKKIDFDETKKQFFNKKRKKKIERPKFKKKGVARDSFRIPAASLSKNAIDIENGKLKIPKISVIKMIVDRKFNGIAKSITISKNRCNQYFVSILVEEELELKQNTGKSVGIDLGLNNLMTFSDGIKIKNPRWFRDSQSKLRKAQQHLSRKKKESNRYEKQRLKFAKTHLKISNQRKFMLDNISTEIINNYDIIIMEDLNVEGMKKGTLSKSISDASFSIFTTMLKYKCNWYGKLYYQVDRWFPSSKLCSSCGYKNNELLRDDTNWTCINCGVEHNRDLNAAKNLLNKGLKDLYDLKSEELPDYKRGEAIRLFRCLHLRSILDESLT